VCTFEALQRVEELLWPKLTLNTPGWSNDERHGRSYSWFHHQSFSLPISSALFWFSSIVLYKVCICQCLQNLIWDAEHRTLISINNIIAHGIPDEYFLIERDTIFFLNFSYTSQSTVRRRWYRQCWCHCFPQRISWLHVKNLSCRRRGAGVYLNPIRQNQSNSRKDEPGRELVQITNQALELAISACGPGKQFRDIGKTIHNLSRDINYSISSQFTGHGIGNVFHSKPWILHHRTLFFP